VRSSAALALAYMEANEAIPMLRDAINDETASTTLRETIRQALKQLE
jgi:HEAT repeat protein